MTLCCRPGRRRTRSRRQYNGRLPQARCLRELPVLGSSCPSARIAESRSRAAAAWTGKEHLRFLEGVSGDDHVDIIGFGGRGRTWPGTSTVASGTADSRPDVRPGTPAPARAAPRTETYAPLGHRALVAQNQMSGTSRRGYRSRRAGAQAADTSPSQRVTRVRIPPSAPADVVQWPRTPYVSAADPDLCTSHRHSAPRPAPTHAGSARCLATVVASRAQTPSSPWSSRPTPARQPRSPISMARAPSPSLSGG